MVSPSYLCACGTIDRPFIQIWKFGILHPSLTHLLRCHGSCCWQQMIVSLAEHNEKAMGMFRKQCLFVLHKVGSFLETVPFLYGFGCRIGWEMWNSFECLKHSCQLALQNFFGDDCSCMLMRSRALCVILHHGCFLILGGRRSHFGPSQRHPFCRCPSGHPLQQKTVRCFLVVQRFKGWTVWVSAWNATLKFPQLHLLGPLRTRIKRGSYKAGHSPWHIFSVFQEHWCWINSYGVCGCHQGVTPMLVGRVAII